MKPFSRRIPSDISNSIEVDFPSSNEITPSFPTLSKAHAIISPISLSFPEEIAATWEIERISSTGIAYSLILLVK